MATNFQELLSTPMDKIEKPKPVPVGHYHGNISGQEYGDNNSNKTPYCRFHVTLTDATDDVPPELLQGVDLGKRKFRIDYFLTEDSKYRLKEFIASCGISTTGRSLSECIPEVTGQAVIAEIASRLGGDKGEEEFSFIKSMKGTAA